MPRLSKHPRMTEYIGGVGTVDEWVSDDEWVHLAEYILLTEWAPKDEWVT